jgi:hypothetical protein
VNRKVERHDQNDMRTARRPAIDLFPGFALPALFLIATTAFAGSAPSMPDPELTPGAVADTDPAIVCARGYSRSHRVWHDKVGTLAKYGIPASEAGRYEDDDRVPVCLGGDNGSPLNHWPEPWEEAERKDELERRICRAVCAGRLALPAAQAIFLGDWRIAYHQ